MKIINARSETLHIHRFELRPGQAWCILGANRSGIEDFFSLACGEADGTAADTLELPGDLGWVSFKGQQEVYENELKKDDTDFLDRMDPGTPARDFLSDSHRFNAIIRALDMEKCLDLGYRQLSTGQSRKLMLLSQMTRGISSLAVQAPFDGLDVASCRELDKALFHLHRAGIRLMLFVYNQADIPDWCTHVGVVADGRLARQGTRDQVSLAGVMDGATAVFPRKPRDVPAGGPEAADDREAAPLVCLKDGHAGYGGKPVFKGLDLTITPGRHTLVTGPNGCGKSTLLQVITGDHPACYRNDLTLFGVRRGSGESIWDLKKHMGIVSQDLHRNYRIPGSTLSCIASGLFDSIGIYRDVSPAQQQQAMAWLDRMGMAGDAALAFRDLSYADQRLVLIARAMIKCPRLLVLDEPTQGLDEPNRMAVLDFLETLAAEGLGTILYVSHRTDEFRPFFRQHIDMGT